MNDVYTVVIEEHAEDGWDFRWTAVVKVNGYHYASSLPCLTKRGALRWAKREIARAKAYKPRPEPKRTTLREDEL
jgi:hypothetical protein